MKRSPLLLLAFFTACNELHVVDRTTIAAERFFLVALDGAGEVRTVSTIYETSGTDQAYLELEGGIADVYLVGLANVRLAAADERFDEQRADQLAIDTSAPPAAGELILRAENAFLRTALPKDISILDTKTSGEASGGARENIERALTLDLPIILDRCAEDHRMHLAPFGATAELLAGAMAASHRGIISVTGHEDRAVMLARGAIYVVERGGAVDLDRLANPTNPDFESTVLRADVLGTDVAFAAITAYFRDVDGQRQFLLAGQESGAAAIWRLALGPNGIRRVERVPIEPPVTNLLRDIAVDGQDIAFAVGDDGLVLTGEVIGRPFIRVATPRGAEGEIRRAAASHILTQPHAIATLSPRLYLGYAWEGYWDEIILPATANGIAASIDGDELWVVGERGMVIRRLSTVVEAPMLAYPPSLSACAVADPGTGRLSIEDEHDGASIDEAFVFFQPQHCTSMIRVRRKDLCVSAIEHDGRGRLLDDRRKLLGSWGTTVVTGGPAGLLLEVVR
jgi:hypothetical protein